MKHGKGIIITTVIIVVICFVAVPLGVNYSTGGTCRYICGSMGCSGCP